MVSLQEQHNTSNIEKSMQSLDLEDNLIYASTQKGGARMVKGRQLTQNPNWQQQVLPGQIGYPSSLSQKHQQSYQHQQQPLQQAQSNSHYVHPVSLPPNVKFNQPRSVQSPGYRSYTLPAQGNPVTFVNGRKVHTLPNRATSRRVQSFNRSLSAGEKSNANYNLFQQSANGSEGALRDRKFEDLPLGLSMNGASYVDEDRSNESNPISPDDGISLTSPIVDEVEADSCSLGLVGKSVPPPEKHFTKSLSTLDEDSGSDTDLSDTHPNKFPIAIEEHANRMCGYKRQPVRSGPQVKVMKKTGDTYSPVSPIDTPEVEQELMRRFYRKDLVRVCVCGRYETKEPLLENRGRDNDADGYEVHYNIKCKWKSYEDFKTKKRVIIRLCKCYKPSF